MRGRRDQSQSHVPAILRKYAEVKSYCWRASSGSLWFTAIFDRLIKRKFLRLFVFLLPVVTVDLTGATSKYKEHGEVVLNIQLEMMERDFQSLDPGIHRTLKEYADKMPDGAKQRRGNATSSDNGSGLSSSAVPFLVLA